MMHKKDILNMAHRVLHPKKSVRDHQIMHPVREWTIGLLVGTIIFIGSAVWSAHMYISHQDITVDILANDQTQVVYRSSVVEQALDVFAQRKSTRDSNNNNEERVLPVEPEESTASSTEGATASTSIASDGSGEVTPTETPFEPLASPETSTSTSNAATTTTSSGEETTPNKDTQSTTTTQSETTAETETHQSPVTTADPTEDLSVN